ncbi:MAG: Transcriptional regulator [Parcubacteria group bacterium GW2011_GWC2_39_14]|nr:MAG: Transcriptional regulator [Parcubacteria group bacterium GW2011_GWC2_39_14]KKR55276.1 MAG: Transcriptional regulator [Parcubacteria group bacterium GW2011_GWA2_40_23]
MSGHSKWATTKNAKAAADAKRSSSFTKLSKNISIAARKGGDPDTNFSLRLAIDKAKEGNMPKENIDRAIKRGTGELEGATLEEVMYEGYGPSGVAVLVEAVTDNKNRTTPEIRSLLTRAGGSLGAQNAVQWMFEHKGVIRVKSEQITDKDNFLLSVIDFGSEDVIEEDGGFTVRCAFSDFEKVKRGIEALGLKVDYAEVEWVAKDLVEAAPEAQESVNSLVDTLEAQDDVNGVYTNLK